MADGFDELSVLPIAGAIGAEVVGLDLTHDLPETTIAAIRRAWLAHGVLFFREQDLSPHQFLDFAQRFGDAMNHPFLQSLPEAPGVMPVIKLEQESINFGGYWHSDAPYHRTPPMAAMVIAREVPPYGGDTNFASGTAAYEALSPTMQRILTGLTAINSSAKVDKTRPHDAPPHVAGEVFEASHPIVRTNPETGRRSLYVSPGHTTRIEGMTEAESEPLLGFLFAHMTRPEFTCRFRWKPGSIAFFDNRCVMHHAINDYHGFRRIMYRVTLAGDRPY